jgi:hypothetical protein
MTLDELLREVTKRVTTFGSRKQAAAHWGVSAQYLGDILDRHRPPGPRLLQALGLHREVTYVQGRRPAHTSRQEESAPDIEG